MIVDHQNGLLAATRDDLTHRRMRAGVQGRVALVRRGGTFIATPCIDFNRLGNSSFGMGFPATALSHGFEPILLSQLLVCSAGVPPAVRRASRPPHSRLFSSDAYLHQNRPFPMFTGHSRRRNRCHAQGMKLRKLQPCSSRSLLSAPSPVHAPFPSRTSSPSANGSPPNIPTHGQSSSTQSPPLFVDTRLKEYTTGAPHDLTTVSSWCGAPSALTTPCSRNTAHWQWQRGGWLLVDRLTGRVSQLNLPEFDPYYRPRAGIATTSPTAESPTTAKSSMPWWRR